MSEIDLSEFERLSVGSRKKPCALAEARVALKPAERAKLDAAVEKWAAGGASFSSGAIGRWLEQRGLKVNGSTFTSHKNRKCSCYE